MRICIIAPLVAPLGPASPGGAEKVALDCVDGFAQRGHKVDLIACKESVIPPKVQFIDLNIATGELTPLRVGVSPSAEDTSTEKVFGKVETFLKMNIHRWDIIHAHPSDRAMFFLDTARISTVQTIHLDTISTGIASIELETIPKERQWVAPSHFIAKQYANLGIGPITVIPNGIANPKTSVPQPRKMKELVWVGRISPEKGLWEAMQVAQNLGVILHIIGKEYDHNYFLQCQLVWQNNALFRYYGYLTTHQIQEIMAGVGGVLMPSLCDESFGMVAVEALMVGTPVVAFSRGGLCEIIEHGKTGFLVHTTKEMEEAVLLLPSLSIEEYSSEIMQKFSLENMLQKYEELFWGIIAKKKNQVR